MPSGSQNNKLMNYLDDSSSEYIAKIKKSNFQGRAKYEKWTQEEDRRYFSFLKNHAQGSENCPERKPKNFFKSMAEFIGSGRTNQHCRSHHQKYLKRHKNEESILKHLEKRFSAPQNLEYLNFDSSLQQIINSFKANGQETPLLKIINEGYKQTEAGVDPFDFGSYQDQFLINFI